MKQKTKAKNGPLEDMRKALKDAVADKSLDDGVRFDARLSLARLDAVEKRVAGSEDRREYNFTDDGLSSDQKLGLMLTFLLRNAVDSATEPMDRYERKRLIDAAAVVHECVSSIQGAVAQHPAGDVIRGDLLRALVAAWQIGMFGNFTKSADAKSRSKKNSNGGKQSGNSRKQLVKARQDWVAERVRAIKERHPKRPHDKIIDDILGSWNPQIPRAGRKTLENDLATLNKAQRTG